MTQSFADSIFIEFDKPEYYTGDSIIISGQIMEFNMPVIAMSIFDPDGKILSANNVEVNPNGSFLKSFSLDSTFYNKSGEYQIKLDYGKITQNEFFIIVGPSLEAESSPTEPITPEIVLLMTDKTMYHDNDTLMITGFVSDIDFSTVLIGVYDPFGNPTGFYFEPVNSNLEFSTNFQVKAGVNFKTEGTYSIQAHYGESEEIIFFDYYKDSVPVISEKEIIGETYTEISNDENNSFIEPIDIPDSSLIKDDSPPVKDNSKNFETKSIKPITPIKKNRNLSVEDIELGKLLNQINLDCDNSKFTDTISYYDGMGPALYRLCKFDQALIFFDDSLNKDPNNVEILTNKGSALGKLGRLSESLVYYERAIEINPNFIPAINNKANALARMGQFEESVSLYNYAIEVNPDFQTARKNLSLVLSEMPSDNSIVSLKQDSRDIESETLLAIENSSKLNMENSSKLETESTVDIFEDIRLVFSSLGSLFNFLK